MGRYSSKLKFGLRVDICLRSSFARAKHKSFILLFTCSTIGLLIPRAKLMKSESIAALFVIRNTMIKKWGTFTCTGMAWCGVPYVQDLYLLVVNMRNCGSEFVSISLAFV